MSKESDEENLDKRGMYKIINITKIAYLLSFLFLIIGNFFLSIVMTLILVFFSGYSLYFFMVVISIFIGTYNVLVEYNLRNLDIEQKIVSEIFMVGLVFLNLFMAMKISIHVRNVLVIGTYQNLYIILIYFICVLIPIIYYFIKYINYGKSVEDE